MYGSKKMFFLSFLSAASFTGEVPAWVWFYDPVEQRGTEGMEDGSAVRWCFPTPLSVHREQRSRW